MTTYTGMNLKGEVRESISLDEDDLSDVEDEVFIRDGKNGYKLAEELNMKRPLMAPRRRTNKSEINIIHRHKPSCRIYCKPCCYICAALSIFIGLISIVAVLVSMYPLPLDKFKEWTSKKSQKDEMLKLLQCDNLKVTDVWSMDLPKIASDSSMRTVDTNDDGVEDLLFGFGIGEGYNELPPKEYCLIFFGRSPPCDGGVIALNGVNGEIMWTYWTNDTIFSLQCTEDVNGDETSDCLASGKSGTILMLNPRNGTVIWQRGSSFRNLYVANFISDQNNDSISDVITSHSSLNDETTRDGHIILMSGKSGEVLNQVKTPYGRKTFYMPQLLQSKNDTLYVCIGTGTPISPGNLTVVPLDDVISTKLSNGTKVIYKDKYKGVVNPSILIDITGDNVPDIITAMYNSTLVAIDGSTFEPIWNFTIAGSGSETSMTPTPAYFTFDNRTDFLIVYDTIDDIMNNTYTQTFIIDGKTGESIYGSINGGILTQMSGLTLSMESHGYDMFLFWTTECAAYDANGKKINIYDDCRNNSKILKLNALGQFHQPPGFTIFSTADRNWSIPDEIRSPIKQLREYYKKYPPVGQSEVDEDYQSAKRPIILRKYGNSVLKHKDNMNDMQDNQEDFQWARNLPKQRYDTDYAYSDYMDPAEETALIQKQNILKNKLANRDPRNKDMMKKLNATTKKKNLSEKSRGIYDTHNVHQSRNRLLHDLDDIPIDILKDTFVKNEENRLRRSKFEQRDVNLHYDKLKEKEEIRNIIEQEIESGQNASYNLWDLESEKEIKDRIEGYRGKREVNYISEGMYKVISVGALLDPLNKTNGSNSIDIVFAIYWEAFPIDEQQMWADDIKQCIDEKISKDYGDVADKTIMKEKSVQARRQCIGEQENLKNEFRFTQKLHQIKRTRMSVYRLNIECECLPTKGVGNCVNFLPKKEQSWPCYLGKFGNGTLIGRS